MSWLLWGLVGCDWLTERYVTGPPAPPPPEVPLPPVRIAPPRPLPGLPPGTDSRPEPPPSPIAFDNCDDLPDGGPVEGPDCLTDAIACDQTVIGHTRGGVKRYDTEFYESAQCTPATQDHDGGDERVYRLDMPDGDWVAFVTLYTPCADLDVAGYPYVGEGCPPAENPIQRCEENKQEGDDRERLVLVSQRKTSWYLIVEGEGDEEGLFSLAVQCRPGLH